MSTQTTASIEPHALGEAVYGHPVMVTEAPRGVPATVLGRLATPDLHTAVYVPSPERRNESGVASEALEALGKRNDVTGKARHATSEAELVPLWLTAHRTRYLLAAACQRTPAQDLIHLAEMTALAPTSLLLACDHGFAEPLLHKLAAVAPVQVPWPELPTASDGAQAPPTAYEAPRWQNTEPVLPDVEYWTFYATAKRQLAIERFQPVHDLYCETMARIASWLDSLNTAGADLTVELAHGSLKTLIEEQTTFDRVTVVTRAAQAAYHRAGWFLDIDERELRNGLVRFPPSMTTPDLYDRLRAYREPTRAATVALYLAGATPEQIRSVTVDDLAQWHHNPDHTIAGQPVPTAAAPFLRAALYMRAFDGANPAAPAFPGDRRRVALDLRQAAADLDLNMGDAKLHETSTIGSRRVPTTIVKLEYMA